MQEGTEAQLLARARKGLQTRILTVSPISEFGETKANELATAAIYPSKYSQEYVVDNQGLQGLYWPV